LIARIDGQHYRIEFSYRRKPVHARDPHVVGVAACAIVRDDFVQERPKGADAGLPSICGPVAVGAAVCAAGDQWSRRKGRAEAFHQALANCRLLPREAFEAWFRERFPEPVKGRCNVSLGLSAVEIAWRIEAGAQKRAERKGSASHV
jgi:hypothetical protein